MEKLTFVDIPTTADRARGKHRWLFDALVEASKKGKAITLACTAENRLALSAIAPTIARNKIAKRLRRLTQNGKITVWLVDHSKSSRKF